MHERFVYTDFKDIRAALFTSIPQPTNDVAGTAGSVVIDDQQVGTHQCLLKPKHEEICGRYFKSEKAFNKHMMKSLQHEQAPMPSACASVCSNQYPWCPRIPKNKYAAEAYVTRAFKNGRCQKAQLKASRLSMRGKRSKTNDMFFCKFCAIDFDNLLEYNKHAQLQGSPGSGFCLQPIERICDQDVAEVRIESKFTGVNKAKTASSQRYRRKIKRSNPPADIGAHRKTNPEHQSASRCAAHHDTTLLDVIERHGVGHPNADGARVVRQKTWFDYRCGSLEHRSHSMRNLGGHQAQAQDVHAELEKHMQ